MPYNNHVCTILEWLLSSTQSPSPVKPTISVKQDIHEIHPHQIPNMEDQRGCVEHSTL